MAVMTVILNGHPSLAHNILQNYDWIPEAPPEIPDVPENLPDNVIQFKKRA